MIAPPTQPSEDLGEVFDVRNEDPAVDLLDTQTTAINALSADSGARVSIDDTFGTPRQIVNQDGFLTDPTSGSAVDVARAWVLDNRDAFGLSEADVQNLAVNRDHELPDTGTHVVTFQQVIGGEETVYGGRLNVAVKDDGRVLSYTGDPTRGDALDGDFSLSEADALDTVAGELAPNADFSPQATSDKRNGYTVFERGPFAAEQYVRRVAFPTSGGAIPAFEVIFVEDLDRAYDAVVDARSGDILFRRSLVSYQALPEASGQVYPNYPGSPGGGTQQEVSFAGDEQASPCGWLDDNPACQTAVQADGAFTTGNNADTHENWNNFIAPDQSGQRANDSDATQPGTQFDYEYPMANSWPNSQCAAAEGQTSYENDLQPATSSLFWHHNRIHDEYYNLGFDESAGNFQLNNYTDEGSGGDPVLGLVQAGAASGGSPTYTGRDNAYFLEMPDGLPSWSGMFLWEPIPASFLAPCRDGDFDAGVIQHEYSHGLSTRYVAGGEALNSFQSGSMGEGWGDWYALDYAYQNGFQDEAIEGAYVTGNYERGIRNWNYDINPTTYGDIGYDIVGPEVHADGEIWTATLWDLRKALVDEFGETEGGEIARHLITDGMPLTAPDPSFLDARDGILLADEDRYDGQYSDIIWDVFAKRGMGASATTDGGDDTDPEPGFDHIDDARNGNLVGRVVNDSTGKPVEDARVLFGDYEARATPVSRTGENGGFGEKVVAGTYSLTIQAPGYGSRTFNDVEVAGGRSKKINVSLVPNLVSERNGAKVVSSSSQDPDNPARNLVDDSEATVWSTEQEDGDFDQVQTTVRLKKISTVRAIRLSAFKNISGARFAAMKNWTFETSTNGKDWKVRKRGAFPTDDPRPVTPELDLERVVLGKPVQAKFVRFTINSTQDDSVGYAQAAELQVYSQTSEGITPMKTQSDRPFTDEGTIEAGNSSIMDPNFGVTGNEFQASCEAPPASQGADGWVSTLPDSFGDGNHVVSVTGAEPDDHDIDLYFFNSQCEVVGSQATASANESGVLPGGAKYVLTALYSGTNEDFELKAQTAP